MYKCLLCEWMNTGVLEMPDMSCDGQWRGFYCCLEKGHSGKHHAHSIENGLFVCWHQWLDNLIITDEEIINDMAIAFVHACFDGAGEED